jgi:serine/threonine-protein kinase
MKLSAGTMLAGKYRIDSVLGAGGMGVVVAAHHVALDRKVAIKFLLPEALNNTEAVARFEREARAAAKITSEHVARVIDVGELESGAPFMVMEYLQGIDLAAWLHQRGALEVEQAVAFVLQACEALAEAHSLGIVHRDLKPANLFCIQRPDGELSIKIIDFGISKVTPPGAKPDEMTRTTTLMGSPHYMSPEQMRAAKNVDARSDIWSLGVILFELLTKTAPFEAEALTELAVKVTVEPAPLLGSLLPEAPPKLEEAINRCLEKERERRFANVGELALALKSFGGRAAPARVERTLGTLRESALARSTLPDSARGDGLVGQSPAPLTAASWWRVAPERTSRRRTAWALVGAGGGIAIALLGWAFLGGGARPAPAAAVAARALPVAASLDVAPAPTTPAVAMDASPVAVLASASAAPAKALPRDGSKPAPQGAVGAGRATTRATSSPPTTQPSSARVPTCKLVSKFDAQGEEHFVKECR